MFAGSLRVHFLRSNLKRQNLGFMLITERYDTMSPHNEPACDANIILSFFKGLKSFGKRLLVPVPCGVNVPKIYVITPYTNSL